MTKEHPGLERFVNTGKFEKEYSKMYDLNIQGIKP